MFPAQALAEEMLARGWRVRLATDARGARYAGGFPPEVERRETRGRDLRARQPGSSGRSAPLAIARGRGGELAAMRRERPACVAGFGGYPALPALIAAWRAEGAAADPRAERRAGRVNRFFAPRVGVVACGVWPTQVPAGAKAVHTGNPVRAAVLDRCGADLRRAGRLADGAARHRRQPGGGALRTGGAGGAAAAAAGVARADQAQPAGAAGGHGPGAGGLRGDRAGGRAAAPSSRTCRSGWRRRRW